MTNGEIADVFDLMADLLEFRGENPFRIRAYRNGAQAIRNLTQSVASLIDEDPGQLRAVGGIGKAVAEKCEVLVRTGSLPQLEQLRAEIPASVLSILRIPNVGPKKAAALYRELGIETLEQLQQACEAGRVRELKHFGAKTEQVILDGIGLAQAAGQRIDWADADEIVGRLREHLGASPEIEQLEFAGSYRRGRETVGDLDVLVTSRSAAAVMDRLADFPGVSRVLLRGETKMSVRLEFGLQIDLRIVPAKSFGAALQYFTGSKEHNVVLRGRAKQRGLKINEYGVYRVTPAGEEFVAGASESQVYAALDLPCFPPELREAREEFHWADAGELPELVRREDLQGDLHMHTMASDGVATIEEMVQAARQCGLKYVAITDHSQRVSVANGLDPRRLQAQWRQIDRLNQSLGPEFTILKGVECDILEKGGLDLPDEVLAQADWVLASIHFGQRQPREQITARLLQALENPWVSAIAHPTGRLINRRPPYDVDTDSLFAAAAEHGKMLELNANPWRLDLDDVLCATAKQRGIPIVINSDAHDPAALATLRYGVLQARRAGLTPADVANTQSWDQLKQRIGTRG